MLGHFPSRPEVKVLVKLVRPPLPGNGPELLGLLHHAQLSQRMPYSGEEYAYFTGTVDVPSLSVDVIAPHAVPNPGESLSLSQGPRETQRAVVCVTRD